MGKTKDVADFVGQGILQIDDVGSVFFDDAIFVVCGVDFDVGVKDLARGNVVCDGGERHDGSGFLPVFVSEHDDVRIVGRKIGVVSNSIFVGISRKMRRKRGKSGSVPRLNGGFDGVCDVEKRHVRGAVLVEMEGDAWGFPCGGKGGLSLRAWGGVAACYGLFPCGRGGWDEEEGQEGQAFIDGLNPP